MNLAHLLHRSARWRPDATALAVGGKVVADYGVLSRRVAGLAAALRGRLALRQGDRVALAMKNCPEYWEVFFACWHAGLAAVPMNAKLHPREFEYILEDSGAKACFVTRDLTAAVPRGIELDEGLFGDECTPAAVRAGDPAWPFYTSGTTGVAK